MFRWFRLLLIAFLQPPAPIPMIADLGLSRYDAQQGERFTASVVVYGEGMTSVTFLPSPGLMLESITGHPGGCSEPAGNVAGCAADLAGAMTVVAHYRVSETALDGWATVRAEVRQDGQQPRLLGAQIRIGKGPPIVYRRWLGIVTKRG